MTHNKPISVMDVTLRDGNYIFQHQLSASLVRDIVSCLDEAGLPYIELGHGISVGATDRGIMAAETDIGYAEAAQSVAKKSRLGMIALPALSTQEQMESLRPHLDFLRVGCNVNAVEEASALVSHAKKIGYEVFFQMIRSSRVGSKQAAESAKKVQDMGADVIYVVDSAGCFSPWEVAPFIRELRSAVTVPLGFHAHNHLGVALANSLLAVQEGCQWVDASLRGIGRGAGNVPLELLLIHLDRMKGKGPIDLHTVEIAAKILDEKLPLEKRGIGRAEYLPASYRFDLYPWELYLKISETFGIEIQDLIEELSRIPGIVEILPEHLEMIRQKLGLPTK